MTTPTTSSSSTYAIGIDFGGTSVKLGRVLPDGTIAARTSFPTVGMGVDAWLDAVEAAVPALLEGIPADARFAGIGVGVPGFVDFDTGFVYDLANVPGWASVPLAERLRSRFPAAPHVVIENDVNAMAAGECAIGAGAAYRDAVFVTLGTGVGGAILINHKLYRGAHSMAGEIGHISIDRNGPQTATGKGGVEQYVGNRQIVKHALDLLATAPASTLLDQVPDRDPAQLTPRHISAAAEAGDALALRVFDDVADCLATMLASVAYTIQPEAFIIGGGVANAGEILFDPLRRHLNERLSPYFSERLTLRPATLGADAGLIGCAMLALQA
ncbi:MAG: ROK family protein [Kiritimatiellae bacterium]|nr:ROK family protein [Kiritimatiellia bacterium]